MTNDDNPYKPPAYEPPEYVEIDVPPPELTWQEEIALFLFVFPLCLGLVALFWSAVVR